MGAFWPPGPLRGRDLFYSLMTKDGEEIVSDTPLITEGFSLTNAIVLTIE